MFSPHGVAVADGLIKTATVLLCFFPNRLPAVHCAAYTLGCLLCPHRLIFIYPQPGAEVPGGLLRYSSIHHKLVLKNEPSSMTPEVHAELGFPS